MDPTASTGRRSLRFAWSRSHWLHTIFALAAVVVYVLGGIAHSRVSGLPPDLDLDALRYPLIVGDHQVGGEDELLARVAGEPVGSSLPLRELDGSTIAEVTTQKLYTSFHDLVIKINGLFFLAVSLIVFAPRIEKVPARDLYWACLLYGLAVMIGDVHQPQGAIWPGALLPVARIVALVLLPAAMLHVGLSFPPRTGLLDRYPQLMPAVLLVGLVVASWQIWAWTRWWEVEGSWAAVTPARRAGSLYLALIWSAGCVAMVLGYRRSAQELEREQVKWLLWGITVGVVPYVFFYGFPRAFDRPPLLPVEVARLFSLVIPIAMSFVVVRHKWLDVDIIIRRSLLYVLLASLMVGVYAVIGILIGNRVEERWPETGPFVPIVATVVAAVLFSPTRHVIANLIDRVVFQIHYNHAQALIGFRGELRDIDDQQQIAEGLANFLRTHLGPRVVSVLLEQANQRFLAGDADGDVTPTARIPEGLRVLARPGKTARPGIETDEFPAPWRNEGYVLAQAIMAEGHRFGHLLLGEKTTGRSYVAEELDLVAAACREAAICFHHMNLKQDFVKEVVARHQVEEMNRFRSQFFAQFAHDLRSPLTSINWAARNMLDGVVGEVSPPQARYLQGIDTSARQLVRLVNNLLEATRLESGLPEVELAAVDLAAVVAESVAKLEATAGAKNLELHLQSAGPTPVHGNEEKLLEVVDNLLENAIRYAPAATRIDVHIGTENQRAILMVADEGPGIDPEEFEVIFEPYRQGSASPHSTQQGFGLGLFVVKSWVERMGGEVEVANREGGGARFTVSLPIDAPIALEELP